MVLVSWFKEFRTNLDQERVGQAVAAAQPLRMRLLQLLSATDPALPTPGSNAPYSELSRIYTKMRGEAGALIKHAEASGYSKILFPDGIPSTEGLNADAAIELATRPGSPLDIRPAGDPPLDDKIVSSSDMYESTRQRLLATAGYLTSLQASTVKSRWAEYVWVGSRFSLSLCLLTTVGCSSDTHGCKTY